MEGNGSPRHVRMCEHSRPLCSSIHHDQGSTSRADVLSSCDQKRWYTFIVEFVHRRAYIDATVGAVDVASSAALTKEATNRCITQKLRADASSSLTGPLATFCHH
jgi:hypothetical protein